MEIKVDDKDIKRLQKDLKKELDKGNAAVDQALKETASTIEKEAKNNAPYDTGHLKRSTFKGKDEKGYFVANSAEYAIWVEYGNRWWVGQPFFAPAIQFGLKFLEDRVKQLIK